MIKLSVLILVSFFPFVCAADSNYVYKIERNKTVIFLFGGLHAYFDESARLSDCVVEAAKTSHAIYLETDPYLVRYAANTYVSSIKGKDIIEQLGKPALEQLSKLASGNMTGLYDQNAAFLYGFTKRANPTFARHARLAYEKYGTDYQLYTIARKNGIALGEIESAEAQLNNYESRSIETWVQTIEYMLDIIDNENLSGEFLMKTTSEMEAAASGDEEALLRNSNLTIAPLFNYYKNSILDRNVTMADTISNLANSNSGRKLFISVGAAHLPGNDGIVSKLKAKGFSAKRTCLRDIPMRLR